MIVNCSSGGKGHPCGSTLVGSAPMSPYVAAAWALTGTGAVEALEMADEIRRSKFKWPWRGKRFWPSLVALCLKLLAAALLAAAMSDQFVSRWPAFLAGVAAPLILTRLAENTSPVEGLDG